jgi:hypothetical protein
MTDSSDSKSPTPRTRDEALALFEALTSKIEAALDYDDVVEVAFLLSERESALAGLLAWTRESPLPDDVIGRLQERDQAFEARLLKARSKLDDEAGETRAKGRAARLYVKNG